MQRVVYVSLLTLAALVGCQPTMQPVAPPPDKPSEQPAAQADPPAAQLTLAEARKGHVTRLARRAKSEGSVDAPPADCGLRQEAYPSAVGSLPCYVSVDPGHGKKHPAIVWITGGDCNSIGDIWSPAEPENDQTAVPYRKAGIVMMYPALRGGNNSEGVVEGFYGEVDDVIAAADFLARQPYVDPQRIYLGGHSTGGTLVLLVSEFTNRFRAVFSFGPVDNILSYGPEMTPIGMSNSTEAALRSPGLWLASIKSPTFVLEGVQRGNVVCIDNMLLSPKNDQVHFIRVQEANHFDILDPLNRLIAQKILHDDGPQCNITLDTAEADQAFAKTR